MIRTPTSASTEVINRSVAVEFYFGRKRIAAYKGETIASALMAAGVSVFSRSFKYHRPRGPHCLSGQCGRCAMTVNGRPNVRTCHTEVQDGMHVEPQSKLESDYLSIADKADWLMPPGFYYKRFHKPAWVWPYALRRLRTAGGNHGHVPAIDGKVRFDHVNLAPELLVIGGGLAGLEAALTGARVGVRVVLVESEPRLGGVDFLQGPEGQSRVRGLTAEVMGKANIRVLLSTHASALYPGGTAFCVQSNLESGFLERAYHIDPRATVVAAGAASRPLVFGNNDRPGILLPEAALKLVNLFGLVPANPVLFAGGDDQIAEAAIQLAHSGVKVAGVADYRSSGFNPQNLEKLEKAGIPFFPGHMVIRALGSKTVQGSEIAEHHASAGREIGVEAIVASGGRSPRHKLLGMAGAKIVYNPGLNMHVPETLPPRLFAAGRLLGFVDPDAVRYGGRFAGAQALASIGVDARSLVSRCRDEFASAAKALPTAHPPQAHAKSGKSFVCFCHDVTQKDIQIGFKEGFDHVESAKRYTTATMGPCQGGSCHENFSQLISDGLQEMKPTHPLTTPRPASFSMSFGALAAGHHVLVKRTPLHEVQKREGGKAVRIGPWVRMESFGDVRSEVRALHENVGIYDASTLGKFLLFGPDAERLWNHINTNNIDKVKQGKILYTATCNEEGVPIDDGILIKLADGKFYLTTSTARAPMTPALYRKWCAEKGWTAYLIDWTDRIAAINLTGPKARTTLEKLTKDNLSNEAFPYMHWRQMDIGGVRCFVFRLGFTGELSYELHFPASYAPGLYHEILSSGRVVGLRPFGTEALLSCRLEKGHILPGKDTDANTSLRGAFGSHVHFLWDRTKPDMVGGPVLRHLGDESRMGVVGFAVPGDAGLYSGFIVKEGGRRSGHVTSVCYSEALGKTVGLVLVDNHEQIRMRGRMILFGDGREVAAEVQNPPFYDPKGERTKS